MMLTKTQSSTFKSAPRSPPRLHRVRCSSASASPKNDASIKESAATKTDSGAWLVRTMFLHAPAQYAALVPAAIVFAGLFADNAVAADLHHNHQFDIAENQEFWGNVLRYGRYFVTVMLGTGYVMLRPLANMFKNPVSAIFGIAGVAGGIAVTYFTVQAMLGLQEPFEYNYN